VVMAFRGCSSLREESEEGGGGVSWVLLPKSLREESEEGGDGVSWVLLPEGGE